MAHKFMDDDVNIIKQCREYGFCCTYDTEKSFHYKSVTDAIAEVLASRRKQSEKLDRIIASADVIMEPLQKLIYSMGELAQISGSGIGMEADHQNAAESYRKTFVKEQDRLEANLSAIKKAQRVMERKNIRVPVVGAINSGKSTFLHSALGGGLSDKVKKNLFPSAGAHKSCTGTRTVLIYDNSTEGVMAVAKFKDKATFLNDCRQAVRRMIGVLDKSGIASQYAQIHNLEKSFAGKLDPVALLNKYYQSGEFKELCRMHYDNRDAEAVYDFCSLVHFAMNQDYSEDKMDVGISKNNFNVNELMKSWDKGIDYSMRIPSENDFEMVKKFVCKYDPDIKKDVNRYTTYCGVQTVEIRGNLCGEIAGLELVDSVGANDDAISNEEQMKILMQDSDAVILLERPQAQEHRGWSVGDCICFVREQDRMPNQFLYLAYNCFNNNTYIPSDLYHSLEDANKYYSGDCKRIYVSDVGEWEEVQSRMLVDMLVNLSNSVEETHKKYIDMAQKANASISDSFRVIRDTAKELEQAYAAEDKDAAKKKNDIDEILKTLFGEVEKLISVTGNENKTALRTRANEITENLSKTLNLNFKDADFRVLYEYMLPVGSGYAYNRYTAFICMYAHMLEDIKWQYNILKSDINAYVENKRQELVNILWESGRFKCIMSDLGPEEPDAAGICRWLRRGTEEVLADVFADVLEDLLLKDIGVEGLIDGSIGKVIERFHPKNMTVEQLFGQSLSNPELEKNEADKMAEIEKQLSVKADELKTALMASVSGNTENSSDAAKERQEGGVWKSMMQNSNQQNDAGTYDSKRNQHAADFDDTLFDLDRKVRIDVVCDGILKKFRDKLRGEDLSGNAKKPIDQLYNLYNYYYDILLSKEEVLHKKHLSELRYNIDMLAKKVVMLCQNGQ